MTSPNCPKCNGEMESGQVSAGEELRFVSSRQTGMVRSPTSIRKARACLNCGYVELYLDALELKKKIGR